MFDGSVSAMSERGLAKTLEYIEERNRQRLRLARERRANFSPAQRARQRLRARQRYAANLEENRAKNRERYHKRCSVAALRKLKLEKQLRALENELATVRAHERDQARASRDKRSGRKPVAISPESAFAQKFFPKVKGGNQ